MTPAPRKVRIAVRILVAIFILWYAALLAFNFAFPQCSSGAFVDSGQVACRIGQHDYGELYREVVMFSFFALAPLGVTFAILCVVLETGMFKAAKE